MKIIIRQAQDKDIPDMAHLMDELGYPTVIDDMRRRYEPMKTNDCYRTLVAEVNGQVVGMIGMYLGWQYAQNQPFIRVVALVVDTSHRQRGMGRELSQHAELWAKDKGASVVALNSGNRFERVNAHRFYRHRGYLDKGIGFYKDIIEH